MGRTWRYTVIETAERLSRVIDAAVAPSASLGLLKWKPRSVAAIRLTAALAERGFQFSTIIDVGANIGQFSRAALGFWPNVDVVAFEPLHLCAEKLDRALRRHGRVEVHRVAVGREDGTIPFRPHQISLSSSALPATESAQREYAWARELPAVEVPIRRLDTILAGRALRRPTLLKLDVQGFELEVLAGAQQTLAAVDAVLVEVAIERAYKNQPLFSEVHDYLRGLDWVLAGPLDVRRERGRIVELDCLYCAPGSRLGDGEYR